mgnify:CR=1 FL=1
MREIVPDEGVNFSICFLHIKESPGWWIVRGTDNRLHPDCNVPAYCQDEGVKDE